MSDQIRGDPDFSCVCLYQGVSWLSRLIRFRTWSVYSHAAWWDPEFGLYEAWYPRMRKVVSLHIAHTPGTRVDLFRVRLPISRRHQIAEWFEQRLGARYDLRGVLGFVSRRRVENPNWWFCSEAMLRVFEYAGNPLFYELPAWKASPGILAYSLALRRNGYVIVGDFDVC